MSMILAATNMHMAFTAPAVPAPALVRFNSPLMSDVEASKESTIDTTEMTGVVAPTGGAAEVSAEEFTKIEGFGPPRFCTNWNPKSLAVPKLPQQAELFEKQFVPEYLKVTPDYLDGTMPGDIGFDPWALTVLAKPPLSVDALKELDGKSRTSAERDQRMASLSVEEQREKLLWMRASELKHGRIAMLAVAGWPLAEMINGKYLRTDYTGGRAPSLFNGHLFDYAPFLFVALAGMGALEFLNKDNKDGDYGFDPLGFGSGIGAMRTLQTAEVKHGRAAMMGITGFAVQEFLYGTPVVEQTPFFFLPLGGFGR